MDYSCRTRALSGLVKDIEKGKYLFNSPLQRAEEQWNALTRSELIDSILRSYPLDPIRAIKNEDGKLDVIDGKQRATTIKKFIENGFSLHKSLEPVIIDGTEYEIAGKRFKKLDEAVQEKISSYEIQVYMFNDCTEKDVRTMFKRQNQGKPLSPKQLRTAIETPEQMDIIFSLAKHPVMSKLCTKAQQKNATDRDIIIQTLMLIESTDEQPWTSFRAKDINNFLAWYADNIDQSKVDALKTAMDKLNDAMDVIKIKSSSIPMMLFACYKVIKNKYSFTKMVDIIQKFIKNYDTNEEYKQWLVSGTSASDQVEGRWNYWKGLITK